MKKHILKGNMPQDGVFFNVAYEDGNIVFYVIDNFEAKGEKRIIKTEDELIEKLLSTKYYNDAEFIEKIVGRFTKYSWCFVKALGIGGAGICMHYKQRLKNKNKQNSMKREIKDLLYRLVFAIKRSSYAGLYNVGIVDKYFSIDRLETELEIYEFAVHTEFNLNTCKEIDYKKFKDALYYEGANRDLKVAIKIMLSFGLGEAISDFGDDITEKEKKELEAMYRPSDELIDELIGEIG